MSPEATIVTVTGPVAASGLGPTLTHEHVMCDFVGAGKVGPHRYDAAEVVRVMRPYLDDVISSGVRAFVDCTPAWLGRDVGVLRRLAELTGLRILTNTGIYGAANDAYVPEHAFRQSAEELAAGWVREWREGIDGSDVRPGFIKVGVDAGPLSSIDRALVRAAALAHLQSGLTIACHTGEAVAAREVLETVTGAGVSPEALIVVHADAIADAAVPARLAADGAWVELDGVQPETIARHLELVAGLLREGYGHQILLSHDAGWYNVGQEKGGSIRPFTTISRELLPELRRRHGEAVVEGLMIRNPARAFRVEVRTLGG